MPTSLRALHRLRNLVGDGCTENCHVPVVLLLLSCLQLVVDLHLVAKHCYQLLHPCLERRHLSCVRGSDVPRHCPLVLAERSSELLKILLQLLTPDELVGGKSP